MGGGRLGRNGGRGGQIIDGVWEQEGRKEKAGSRREGGEYRSGTGRRKENGAGSLINRLEHGSLLVRKITT